ncbi:MAG TPA: hypothetical protein VE088_08695 [Gaiellaceae bacterium]|jgi:hypothetical protein|nr:hypothetical protein [Gaiellaceae bacterium]
MLGEPAIALRVREHDDPALEVRVNFGVFAGRDVTPAEIDALADRLRALLPAFTVVSEERHDFGGATSTSLHQVVIEVPREHATDATDVLAERIVLVANGWALECIEARRGAGDL